ncbi:TetR/AcrR family transcriptional regulator [Rhodovibrionaceae bacterium A322]
MAIAKDKTAGEGSGCKGKPRQVRLAPAERRRVLIETTITCLAKYGAQGTGVRQICRELDVAPSLVNYFFDGLDDLLLCAYNSLSERFTQELSDISGQDYPSAQDKMQAVIGHYLSPDWHNDRIIGAYNGFWSMSRSNDKMRAAMSQLYEGQADVLQPILRELVAERNLPAPHDKLVTLLIVFLNGLWMEMGSNPTQFEASEAEDLCWLWLETALVTGKQPPQR